MVIYELYHIFWPYHYYYCYQRGLIPSNKINLKFGEVVIPGSSSEKELSEIMADKDRDMVDEIPEPEYETNSSGSSSENVNNDEEEGTTNSCAFFMVGRTSRSGRTVKMNSRFFK